ncbi:Biotin operon repressor / Biotin--protein ligase (EC (EC (EC (EC [Olavius algarvensis associated proteobacterium Delta 3]|nr:Biotin operon repressor / Biotin--protein ligase (EC (EC (EC (EC [Olavius algarvensis associated proteobacterium Delta 3]CAB5142944.1 Biotin operon repressor / Biotin--protein ligase (EC (EC (EC (EC [Olavius algarvensis associated proteobacterium Delta 3]
MKSALITILSESRGVVSGQQLSERLGISRVSVWKHIQQLQEFGYRIDAGPKGYRLKKRPDTPFPWEIPEWEDRIHYFPKVASTMDAARDLARKGCPHLTVVVADRQTRGRGRLTRAWQSDTGGLYVTVVTRPALAPMEVARITFAVSLELARTFNTGCGVDARVKWPNDILVDGRKLVGILSEMEGEADRVNYLNIGVGINVNNNPTRREPNAVSLKELTGKTMSRKNILADFLDRFRHRLDKGLDSEVIQEWKTCTDTIGRRVRVETVRGVFEGTAMDVDQNGALVLGLDDGSRQRVIYGDCFHQ